MGDRIAVPLALDDLEVIETVLVDGMLEVEVRSTFPRACFHCGSVDVIGHGMCRRWLRDRSCGYPTVLVWIQRRFRCRDCDRTSRERHPMFAGAKRITNRFLHSLGIQCCSSAVSDVAERETVSWWRVSDTLERVAALGNPMAGSAPRVISLDEASFKKRFNYHTIVSDPEARRVLDMVQGRSQTSAETAIEQFPEVWRANLETIVTDLHWPYRKAIEKHLPDVRLVADRFHVLRSVDAAAHKVRVRHGRRRTVVGRDGGISRQNNPRFNPAVWRNRWVFSKRHHQLDNDESAALKAIFQANPEIGLAWWLKEAFAAIYQAPTRAEAERRLDVWIHHIGVAGIREFTDLWRTLQWWREPILAFHDDRQTNAYAEGITNKIKVLKRRGYGYRNPTRYRRHVLLACGHRPEPGDQPPQFA